ncbi:MAG: hypothetical protein SCK28_02620 [Bacillota bacterium]|nr:hypothetical protein [Bacillota bacterium]
MTPAMVKEIIKWIIDHLDNVEPIKTLLRHVYLPIRLSDDQVDDLIVKIKKAKGNEGELKRIGEELSKQSEENLRQMFV